MRNSILISALALALALSGDAKVRHVATDGLPHDADVQGQYTLTVYIDGLRNSVGNIDMLVFNQADGWPDEIPHSIRAYEVPAVEGNMVLKVENLPPGDYGVIVVHDENLNRRIDKDWRGVPIEQWGMSTNPRVYFRTPSFDRARVHLEGDMQVHVPLKLYP